jgi:predicted O-methyltransferase YrrM
MSFWLEYERRCGDKSDISDHLPRLFKEADQPEVWVLELGVRSGNSTAAFLAAAEKNNGQVWSSDISRPRVPQEFFESPYWTFVQGNDLELGELLPVAVDVLFIDTSHAYRQTLAELNMFAGRVRPGGVILLHDTELEHPDAEEAGDPAFPVAVALREWASAQPDEPMIEWVSGCYGLAVVTV